MVSKMEECFWCEKEIGDESAQAGVSKGGPIAWASEWDHKMKKFYDFGCESSPETSGDGVGSHLPKSEIKRLVVEGLRAKGQFEEPTHKEGCPRYYDITTKRYCMCLSME